MPSKRYKDYRFYAFIALNYIASTLNIDLFQKGLLSKIEGILEVQEGVSKSEIMYEIRSNHTMTNKVIVYLEDEGFVRVDKGESGYRIKITVDGILYLREYSRFYRSVFRNEIADLYRYRTLPAWARDVG